MGHFIQSETGAVTVDWVVLTAALVGVGIAASVVVSGGVQDVSNDITTTLKSPIIRTSFGDPFTEYSVCDQASYDARVEFFSTNVTWANMEEADYTGHVNGMADNVRTDAATTNQANLCNYADQLHALVTAGEARGVITDEAMADAIDALEQVPT